MDFHKQTFSTISPTNRKFTARLLKGEKQRASKEGTRKRNRNHTKSSPKKTNLPSLKVPQSTIGEFKHIKTLPQKKSISFSPTTSVRNQYEWENSGIAKVWMNNYKVNASDNVNMPGYYLSHPQFKSHTKSKLQKKIANAKMMGVKFNGKPALSYVGNFEVGNAAEAKENMRNLKEWYGDEWVTATEAREASNLDEEEKVAKIVKEFNEKLIILEDNFMKAHNSIWPPTALERKKGELTKAQMKEKLMEIKSIPSREISIFTAEYEKLLGEAHDKKEAAHETSNLIYTSSPRGTPYKPRNRKPIENRLRNAKSIANSAAL